MSQLAGAMQIVDLIRGGGPGSGCHGDNCGRPAGPGHELPSKAPNVPGLMKQYGWKKGDGQTVLKGKPANIYEHPKYGKLIVSNNWYEHYVNGVKVAEKMDLKKGIPFAVKLRTYLKNQVQKSKQTQPGGQGLQPKQPKPPIPEPQPGQLKPLPGSGEHAALEAKLATAPIIKTTPRKQEGVSGGLLNVQYADGSKAIFKPHKGEAPDMRPGRISNGYQSEREHAAWELAKLGGVADLVSPVQPRTIDGKKGVVTAFQKGTNAFKANDSFDGEQNAMRAALFDYVLGNEDRHDGNWMVDEGLGKPTQLKMIDHGLSFPDLRNNVNDIHSQLLNHVKKEHYSDAVPLNMMAPYVANKDKIRTALVNAGLPAKSVIHTMDRINVFTGEEPPTWKSLTFKPDTKKWF